jgi:hypothetical protein
MSEPDHYKTSYQWQNVIFYKGRAIALVRANLLADVEFVPLRIGVSFKNIEESLRATATNESDGDRRDAETTL